jgi:chromosome partitioning protein
MNQKGGAGKSTLARALLSAGDSQGLRCAFIDADQTGNLVRWAIRAAQGGLWSDSIDAYQTIDAGEIEEIVDEIEEEDKTDLLVIDTAGDASRDHDIFGIVADLILCPILLSKSDLVTARGTANYLFRMKDRADDPALLPEFHIALNLLPSRPSKGDAEIIRAIHATPLVGMDENSPTEVLKILPAALQEREAYKIMDRKGLLGRTLARHNETSEAFAKNPSYLTKALTEAEALLDACLAIIGKDPA